MFTVKGGEFSGAPLKPFPKIMKSSVNGCIILFDKYGKGNGICLSKGADLCAVVGKVCSYDTSNFHDYNYKITLENG